MKKLLILTAVLAAPAAGRAQIYVGDDMGSLDTFWKLSGVAGPSDWFNQDLSGQLAGLNMSGLYVGLLESGGAPGGLSSLALYPSSSVFAGSPDLTSPCSGSTVVPAIGRYQSEIVYTDFLGGCKQTASDDLHVAGQWNPGDGNTWVATDSTGITTDAYFSFSSYAFGATNFPGQAWVAGVGVEPPDCHLLINGRSSVTVDNCGRWVELCYYSCAPAGLSLWLAAPPCTLVSPLLFGTTTAGGPCGLSEWCISGFIDASVPPGVYTLAVLGVDPCASALCISNCITLIVTDCGTPPHPDGAPCWGQLDDGVMDGTAWKLTDPAGAADWFNVDHGTAPSYVQSITGIQMASWDFCGFGPSWAEVGVYPDHSTFAHTPDLLSPAALAANPALPPGSADWGYPATFYDVPDFLAGGGDYHVAARWPAGDSCIWMGADTDGTDSSCGIPIPSAGSTSMYTSTGYATGATPMTGANWMMKIDWR